MMKSLGKRILGIIVCVSLVFGTVTLPTFADDSVPIPTGENTWQDDDLPTDNDPPASSNGGTQSDPEGGLPMDTDPVTDDNTNGTADNDAATGDADDDGNVVTFDASEFGIMEEGDPPATELDAARRMTISSSIQPDPVQTGAQATLSFVLSYNSAGGTVQIDPAKLRAIVTSPKEIRVDTLFNDMFHLEGTNTDGDGSTVTTLVFDLVPAGGAGSSFEAIGFTTTAGMLADGSAYDVRIKWMYGEDELLDEDQICTVTNAVPTFGWNTLRGAANPVTVTAAGTYVPDIIVQYSLNNLSQSAGTGYAFTKSVEINDLITVDPRMILTEDQLSSFVWEYSGGGATISDVGYEVVSTYDDGSIKEFRAMATLTNDTLGGAAPADMGHINATVKLTIKGLRVNKDKANTGSGGSSTINISYALQSKNGLSANIYPAVEVANPQSYVNKTDGEGVRYQELKATSGTSYNFYTNVYYYWTDYEPEDPTDPGNSGRIEKHVKSITTAGGDVSTDSERLLYAYPGDKITYSLEAFGNFVQGESLNNFMVTDRFDLDTMYPIIVTPGHHAMATGTMYVRVYITENNVEGEAYSKGYTVNSDFSTTQLDLRTAVGNVSGNAVGTAYYNKTLDVTKISKIVFDYSTVGGSAVPFGFRPFVGKEPTVTAVIRNLNKPNPDPESPEPQAMLVNTALVSYTHDGTAYNYDNLSEEEKAIEFNFKDENEISYYQKYEAVETGNKSFIKIRGKNGTSATIEEGDLLEYTITFRNNTDQYAMNPFFDDVYQGLTPYIVDEAAYGLMGSGYEEPFVSLVSVKDAAGYDVTDKRALALSGVYVGPIDYNSGSVSSGAYVYQAPENEPLIGANTMRVRFKSTKATGGLSSGDPIPEYYIHPGDTFTVTYVMKVTDPSKISNKFKSYAYPIYTGSPSLIHFTGGSHEYDGKGAPLVKPTVRLTQTTTKAVGTGSPTSSTYPVEDGEILNVTVVLQNSSVKNASSLTLYGFNNALYGYNTGTVYNDVLKYIQGPVEMKIYKNTLDTSPETRTVTMVNAPASFPDTGANWRHRSAMIFRDSGNSNNGTNLSPVTLNPSMRVEFTFQVKAEGWVDDNATNLTELIRTYAIFKDTYGTYTGTAGSSGSSASNYGTWIDGQPSSPYMSHIYDTNTIYLSKEKVPIVRAWATSYYGDYLALNNLAEGARPERTGVYSHGVQIQNVGRVDLPITKIYVRLPTNERFKRLTPYGTSGHYYAANLYDADVLPGLYGGRQIVVLTPKAEMKLQPNYYAGSNLTSNYYIGIETYVENETAAQMIAARLGTATFTDSKIEVAFYSKGVDKIISDPSSYKISAITDAEKELWGGSALGNVSQGVLYQGLTAYDGRYRAYYPLPGIQLTPLRKFTESGGTVKYEESTTPFSPTEQMAWRITAGLENNSAYLTTLKNAVAVLKLPSSVTYTGIVDNTHTGTAYTGSDGYLYIVVPLGDLKAATPQTFTVAATLGPKYGSQAAEVFLFGSDEFYNVRSSGWGAIEKTETFPSDIKAELGMTPGINMVKNTRSINVSGMFAFSSAKTVNVPEGTAIDRGMAAKSRVNQVLTYTLTLSNEGTNVAYEGLTIIDRLPVRNDKFVLVDETNRGSTTKVTMKTTPVVATATVNNDGTFGAWTTVSTSKYAVQYVNLGAQAATYPFTNADFRLPEDTPSTEASWVDAAAWPAGQEASAFRIIMNDPLPAKTAVRVTYTADAPEQDMPKQDAKAVNSFAAGFQAVIGSVTHKVKPEPDFAQVIFPDIKPMIIEGIVFTEPDDAVDGIYNVGDSHFSNFYKGDIQLTLYKADDAQGTNRAAIANFELDPANGVYKFGELYDQGVYSVEITGIPDGYVIYEEIVSHEQGNKFDTDGLTDGMAYEEGKTYRCNADILKVLKGTLTLEKTLRTPLFGSDDGKVNGKVQKFVFKIEYTPAGENAVTQTFYEVLAAGESKIFRDLPRGAYAVTELEDWATDYFQYGNIEYAEGMEVSRQTPDISAVCTNSRDGQSFLHAVGEAINNFNDKAPKVVLN